MLTFENVFSAKLNLLPWKMLLSYKCCKSIFKPFSKGQKQAFNSKTDHKKNTSAEVSPVLFIYLFLFINEACTNQTKACATEIMARAI